MQLPFPPDLNLIGLPDTSYNGPSMLEVRGGTGEFRIEGILSVPAPCFAVVSTGWHAGRYIEVSVVGVPRAGPGPCLPDRSGRTVEIGWQVEAATWRVVVRGPGNETLVDRTVPVR